MKSPLLSLNNILWVMMVIFLPITSFPLLSKILGGINVAPLSLVFLIPLLLIWLIPNFIKGQGLPSQSVPLLIFILLALISSLAAFYLQIPSFKAKVVWQNEFGEIISLGIGFCFFLITSLWINNFNKLDNFFRLVNISGAVALAYTLIQGFFVIIIHETPVNLLAFQNFLSASQILFVNRVNGLTFEPSWLAHQLNLFYLPIWLGLSIRKITFHKFHFMKLTFENILLITGFIALFLTFSRIGWLACFAYCGYCSLRFMNSIRCKILTKVVKQPLNIFSLKELLFNLGFWFLLLLILIASLSFVGYISTKLDKRMVDLFYFQGIKEWGLLGWTGKLVFAERIVYWIAGYGTFIKHPLIGVGLGNSGFFFPQTINSFGYSLIDIIRILVDNSYLPNIKNLWIRLLAETGIVGFSLFVSWLWVVWKTARTLENLPENLSKAIGIMGKITIIGLIVEGFSIDTFALPYFWCSLGLVVAAFRIFSKKQQSGKTN
ncbi:MAG: hypothetical protein A2X25_03270 [Chloroflexi bacterium GWB2_49_20]|nr:MAG: hypothetical protein A2X25_03270 [Chloroflexi bacterium GWB2_49_20]OGN76118.1 MAG: hypothetical protein A2X26_11545 [Chloroflexi bacterium GWC2_49_37]OGN83504.1 MAG: hypothetical protein A2X27_09380 [Chloroflexi bacterium GWD2_49_16]HBG73905.1 hypothetical protein [Anaerolineae bacterium]HCC79516.1 hypothetical protein [Anaerolineae bacterium]